MKTSRMSQIVWGCLTLSYMVALALASFPAKIIPGEPVLWKKCLHNSLHVPAYAGLTFLIWESFGQKSLRTAALIAFAYGLINEIIQKFVPGRMSSLSDAVLNAIGIFLAVIFIRQILPRLTGGQR